MPTINFEASFLIKFEGDVDNDEEMKKKERRMKRNTMKIIMRTNENLLNK